MIDFSTISYIAILATMACGPFYAFATYFRAGESMRKSLAIATAISIWGIIMTLFVVEWQFYFNNPYITPMIMMANLIWPSALVMWKQDFFAPTNLGIPWLIGVQAFRLIGGLYLLEFFNGFIGKEFAYFAGTGDVLTALIALVLLALHFDGKKLTIWSLYLVTIFGFIDFVLAYLIGIFSLSTPLQLFAIREIHGANLFPIGMIPFLLAPIAMAFHWIMAIKLRNIEK